MHSVKTRILIFFCLLTAPKLRSQSWQPVVAGNIYNYRLNSTPVTLSSVWSDSVKTSATYLNKITTVCDTCSNIHLSGFVFDSLYVWSKTCGFLQHSIRDLGNASFYFKGPRSFLLKLNMPLNAWWLFDTAHSVQAKIIGSNIQIILSVPDSVRTVLLSTNDTIIVSKDHGIIKFPKPGSPGQSYSLAGIEGLGLGYSLPKFTNFFSFNAGDVFQYETINDNYTSFPPYFDRGVEKRTILSKQIIGDTLRYQVRLVRADSAWLGANAAACSFTNTTATIDYIDSVSHFTNLYPKQKVSFNNYFTFTFLDSLISDVECQLGINNRLTKKMGVSCPSYMPNAADPYGLAVSTYSITDLYVATNHNLIFGREAKEQLGITTELFYDFDFLKSNCLSAYRTGGDSSGTILSDAAILQTLSVKELSNDLHLLVYPNPASNDVTIRSSGAFTGTLTIYNGFGETALQQKLNDQTNHISIESLSNGVYLLMIESGSSKQIKKLVIQK